MIEQRFRQLVTDPTAAHDDRRAAPFRDPAVMADVRVADRTADAARAMNTSAASTGPFPTGTPSWSFNALVRAPATSARAARPGSSSRSEGATRRGSGHPPR